MILHNNTVLRHFYSQNPPEKHIFDTRNCYIMGDCTVLDLWWGCWRSMPESPVWEPWHSWNWRTVLQRDRCISDSRIAFVPGFSVPAWTHRIQLRHCSMYIFQLLVSFAWWSLLFGETVGSERFLENLRYQISNYYKNKNWEFVALRYEFPILAGAQGLEPWAYGFGDRRSTNWAIPLY